MRRFLHIADEKPAPRVWIEPFVKRLREIGELTIVENAASTSDEDRTALIRECDVLITCWDASPVPVSIAADPGNLRYICHVTGAM